MQKLSFRNIKEFFDIYETRISAGTLIGGFIFDYLTLQRVDFLWDNLFIVLYLLAAGFCIIIINLYEEGRLRNRFMEKIYEFLPFVLQFCFGGLFSAFAVFYFKSSSIVSGGIFVFILLILLVGNEFFKKRYQRLVFQISIYFVAIFSFSIFFLPVLVKHMGPWVFLGSGALSLVAILAFMLIISRFSPRRYENERPILILTISCLFVFINILYFTKIIPPIPLALKSGDVFHFIERKSDGSYRAIGEDNARWYEKFKTKTVHLKSLGSVYVFSSVFSPTDLKAKIIHDWQYFDEVSGKWVSVSKIDFNIIGGRGNGFRGFTKKENISPGKWRVDIKTERDQIIGRIRFNVLVGEYSLPLKNYTL